MRQLNWFGGVAMLTLAASLAFGQTASPVTINTTSLLGGATGVPYSALLSATSTIAGVAINWSISGGALPGGLILSADGTISGTPNTSGVASFVVQASQTTTDSTFSATQPLTLVINLTQLAITTPSSLSATLGVAYSLTFQAVGPVKGDVLTWSILSGSLPPGLSLTTGGVLSGTPTASGTYPFLIQLDDRPATGAPSSQALHGFTLVIPAGATITITTNPTLPPGSVGVAYTQQLAATGGVPQYAWNVDSGVLPGGVSLNATTGVISGTPTSVGTFSFQVSVTDQSGIKGNGAFTLAVTAPLAITTGPALPAGAFGTPYSTTLAATGGSLPYTWAVLASGGALPPGLTLDPLTGRLAGTPTSGGSYQFLVGVTDAAKRTASKSLSLNITASLTIVTASPLPNGVIGASYQAQLSATGGTPAYTWSITVGTLPAGLTLNAATGLLSGTPTAGGSFNVTVGVKDAVQSATKAYQLTISAAALPAVTITGLPDTPSPATQPALGISLGAAYTQDLTGQAALTFTPDSASDDPAVQFTTGGRNAAFQIPAGTTQAVFASSSLGVQTGTVAGTITITLRVLAAGVDVTPTPAPTKVLRIAAAPPVIISAKLTANSTGFDLVVIGYATTREVTGATVHLTPASGATLATSDFTIPLTTVFPVWYLDPNSVQFGSQFSLHIPFGVQNVANAVGSLTITLTNSQGTSTAANAGF